MGARGESGGSFSVLWGVWVEERPPPRALLCGQVSQVVVVVGYHAPTPQPAPPRVAARVILATAAIRSRGARN